MNIEFEIIRYLNEYARAYPKFDILINFICHNHLFKGGILMLLVYWLWFRRSDAIQYIREHIIMLLISSVVSLFFVRAIVLFLPFRSRPIHNPDIEFILPVGALPIMETWTSFPSDHAVLFFTIATGLWFIFNEMKLRVVGVGIYLYVVLVILFPRVYLGLHFPSDIFFGALGGGIIAYALRTERLRAIITHSVLKYEGQAPGVFYSAFFFITFQIAIMFDPFREIAEFILKSLRSFI